MPFHRLVDKESCREKLLLLKIMCIFAAKYKDYEYEEQTTYSGAAIGMYGSTGTTETGNTTTR